jgi:hypothetical protein
MKKYLLLITGSVIVFIAGILTQKCVQTDSDHSFNRDIQQIINDNNSTISNEVRIYLSQMEKYGMDIHGKEFATMTKANAAADYFEDILSSEEKIKTFSLSKVKSILEDNKSIYLDDFYANANRINVSNNTTEDITLYISTCYNIILSRCLEAYHESSLATGELEGVFFIPTKDVVTMGDTFEAKICFSVKDLTLQHKLKFDNVNQENLPSQDKLVFDNDDTTIFKGNIYKEKAIQKGLNRRKGYLVYLNGRDNIFFPFEFSYHVK